MLKHIGSLMVACFMLNAQAIAQPKLDVTPCKCAMQGISLDGMPWSVEALSNGLVDYMFDLNNDGKADIEFLVPDGDQNRIPLFIWMNNAEGNTRYTLKDQLRDGTCTGMSIVWHQYQPNWRKGA